MNVLAVIPARGGSKGIPRKNLRHLAGRPLIAWSIDAAQAASLVNRVVVSTEDDEIAAVAEAHAAEVIRRPHELATDTASTDAVLMHAADAMLAQKYRPDLIVLLQPTVPIRSSGLVDRAVRELLKRGADALFTARRLHFVWNQHEYYIPEPVPGPRRWESNAPRRPRRQDMTPMELRYEEDGSVYVTRWDIMRETGARISGRVEVLEGDRGAVDIDTEDDLALAEALMGCRHAVSA